MRHSFILKLYHNTSGKTVKTQNVCFKPSNPSKIPTSENVCVLVNIIIEANSVDPDKPEQSDLDLHILSKRLQIFQQTTKAYDFSVKCALIVNKCELNVYTVRIFIKCMHVCAAQTYY